MEIFEEDVEVDYNDIDIDDMPIEMAPMSNVEIRSFYVTKQDVGKYGQHSEKECPGCNAMSRGYRRPLAHSESCRKRVMGVG